MKNVYTKLKNLAFLMALIVGANFTNAQVYVIGNGETAYSVSEDGKVVTLNTVDNNYYWTQEDGIQLLGELAAETSNAGYPLVTADGKKIAAMVMNPEDGMNQMSIFDLDTKTWNYLGGLDAVSGSESSSVWGMSKDGKYIAGLGATPNGSFHGILWNETNGIVDLETKGDYYSRANGVSDDGRIAVGWQDTDFDRWGVYWEDGVQHQVYDQEGYEVLELGNISGNGKWMIGATSEDIAMRYSKETGVQKIEHPDQGFYFNGAATAINNDGSVVVGYYRPWPGPAAMGEGFIWTEETGRIELNEYVKSLGYDDLGITFALPLGLSKDGSKIVGLGRTDSGVVSFLISLPKLGVSDVNTVKFEVYPNPATELIHIETKGQVSSSILYNMAGQKVLNSEHKQIDVSSLPKGIYILKTTIDGKDMTKKIIKK
ncbi:T9SS type A sorting domain-containing protein [Empedobacter brevis]|uniref:T9SS type A sorting domain-containing protein n=1 Tax=Empedobacter brevis TaxID=247 RepID=UPI002FDF1BEF